ncbi:protein FAR-RED IMPAIRED RESPONSE 1-like [Chenopodium quinoa]|uniref:protein FAR-RED IMPAIRED RESPONSE 1-like n=1 Tax=Chenopodium quinoa TaxID=63459 RepID=UPI000B79414E|nr:protein FAR-RED IMPAIRED RESPONSE 1-like [Chenopodium quinoa]
MRARREAKKRAKAMGLGGSGGLVNGVVCEDELSGMKRTSKKCECQARVYAKVNEDGLWELKSMELKHNHGIDSTNSKLVKEYHMKKMTSELKKRLVEFYEQGVLISQIHGCMATERKGTKIFFHAQRLDARSRVAYEDFGDAVCFDATYLTNEYELPFANFVGVNHHGQSLLLGCALISHEDCDTFAWIFRHWLPFMNNRAPKTILTDQTAAMRRPLAEVMPNTVHRWCIWNIMSKIPEKLGKCARYQEFVNPLKELVYESFDPEEFQTRWAEFIAEYKLEDNEWLQSLHKESRMWVPAILDANLVEDLPEKYIPRKHTRVKVAYHDPGDMFNVKRFNKMMRIFESLCETAAMVDDQTVYKVIETLSKLQLAVNERRDKKSKEIVPVAVVSTLSSATEGRTFSIVRNPAPDATAVDSCPAAMDLEHVGNGVEEDAGSGGEEEDAAANGV